MKNAYFYQTKLGRIFIAEDGQGITNLSLAQEGTDIRSEEPYILYETDRLKEAAKELNEYLNGTRREFMVALHPKGTAFQKLVWEALRNIPYGETRSYKQIAEAVGNAKACRAVGMANHKNPVMCIIPCHRVIGSDQSLVGYAGGINIKKQLLRLEQNGGGLCQYE